MNEDWKIRLQKAVEECDDSPRAISLKAKVDASYIHKIIKGNISTPTVPKLLAICEAIGASPAYIISGVHMTKEDEDLIRYFSALDADGRRIILDMARKILGDTSNQ